MTAVADGLEAVRLYERALRRGEQFQAVILDATIRGGMGGLATIERLRSMDPKVNAIICSGYSDEAALSRVSGLWISRGACRNHLPVRSWPTRCSGHSRQQTRIRSAPKRLSCAGFATEASLAFAELFKLRDESITDRLRYTRARQPFGRRRSRHNRRETPECHTVGQLDVLRSDLIRHIRLCFSENPLRPAPDSCLAYSLNCGLRKNFLVEQFAPSTPIRPVKSRSTSLLLAFASCCPCS